MKDEWETVRIPCLRVYAFTCLPVYVLQDKIAK